MAEAQRSCISLECACDQGAAPSDLFAFTTYTPAREPSQGEAVDVILTDGARVWKSRDLNQNASGGKEAAAVRLDKLLQALTDLRPRQHDFAYQMHPTTDGVELEIAFKVAMRDMALTLALQPDPSPQPAILQALRHLLLNLHELRSTVGRLRTQQAALSKLADGAQQLVLTHAQPAAQEEEASYRRVAALLNAKKAMLHQAKGPLQAQHAAVGGDVAMQAAIDADTEEEESEASMEAATPALSPRGLDYETDREYEDLFD